MKRVNMSPSEFCVNFGISDSTYRNWKSGRASPSQTDFERLKQLASGGNVAAAPRSTSAPQSPIGMELILGRLDQLTLQIAHLQGEIGVLRRDNSAVLEDNKEIKESIELIFDVLIKHKLMEPGDAKKKSRRRVLRSVSRHEDIKNPVL